MTICTCLLCVAFICIRKYIKGRLKQYPQKEVDIAIADIVNTSDGDIDTDDDLVMYDSAASAIPRVEHDMVSRQHNGDWKQKDEVVDNEIDKQLQDRDDEKKLIEKGKTISSETDFRSWDHQHILNWIMELEDGMFIKYKDVLEHSLKEKNVRGMELQYVERGDIKMWGIKDFEHRRKLCQHIERLRSNDIEGQ